MGQRWPNKTLKNPTKIHPSTYNNSTTFYNQANQSQTTKIAELTKSQLFQNGSNSIPKRRARRDESNGTNLAIKNLLELSESANQNLVKPGQSQRVDQVNPSSPNDLIFNMFKIDQTTYPWIHLNKRNLPVPVSTLENAGDRRNQPAKVPPDTFLTRKASSSNHVFYSQPFDPKPTPFASSSSALSIHHKNSSNGAESREKIEFESTVR
jgi:hypothetical protein